MHCNSQLLVVKILWMITKTIRFDQIYFDACVLNLWSQPDAAVTGHIAKLPYPLQNIPVKFWFSGKYSFQNGKQS